MNDDGGPAYPKIQTVPGRLWNKREYDEVRSEGGMSLRDWLAGQALIGQLAFSPRDSFDKANQPNDVAAVCYKMADAMLAERARGKA